MADKEQSPKEEPPKKAEKEKKTEGKKPVQAKVKDEKGSEETKDKEEAPKRDKTDKEAIKMEASYPERGLQSGEVYLKRKKGKPRFRKISSKNNQAQLFLLDQGKWAQKSALAGKNHPIRNLKWHLKNKWEKVDKAVIGKE